MVDEVLAVGDAEFQKKCLGKMQDTARSGSTVLFVSHNMSAVQALCDRCILLEGGRLLRYDATSSVIVDYCGSNQSGDLLSARVDTEPKSPDDRSCGYPSRARPAQPGCMCSLPRSGCLDQRSHRNQH